MRIITFSKRVTVITKCAGHCAEIPVNPGERLIFDEDNSLQIQQEPSSASYIESVSDLSPYLAEMAARPPASWRQAKVLIYRNRGIGDQLIVSAASRFFSEKLGSTCFQAVDRVHEPIWISNPFIGLAPLLMPLHLDILYRANGPAFVQSAFFFESVSEWDSDGEQANVYDRLFAMLGFDPDQIGPKFKRPFIALQKTDIDARLKYLVKFGAITKNSLLGGYIFFQIRGTNKVRSLPLAVIKKALIALDNYAEKLALPILVADDQPLNPEIAELVKSTKMAVNVAGSIHNVRLFITLVAGATVVIGPDSSAIHIAAAFEIPAIGIWGPFSPMSRTRYYPRQIHIFHPEHCPRAPCFNYLPDLPVQKCPKGLAQQHCEVFEGVTAQEIFEALKNVNP